MAVEWQGTIWKNKANQACPFNLRSELALSLSNGAGSEHIEGSQFQTHAADKPGEPGEFDCNYAKQNKRQVS